MANTWVTWANLGVTRDERTALRRAGLAAVDLAALQPLDLVAASGEVVSEERAAALTKRASLLEVVTPVWVGAFERVGVTDRAELARRHPDELFDAWQDVSPYTRPDIYRILAEKVVAAGGPDYPIPSDDELIRRAWVRRFGHGPDPEPTGLRLRLPTLKVSASVVRAALGGAGVPRPPLKPSEVAVADDTHPRVVVGHWQWAGTFAAFLRLEHIARGDPVELVSGRAATRFVAVEMARGAAPLAVPSGDLVLLSASHLRWPPWLSDWNLPADADLERTWVQVAVTAEAM